jgi:hypothetical protein
MTFLSRFKNAFFQNSSSQQTALSFEDRKLWLKTFLFPALISSVPTILSDLFVDWRLHLDSVHWTVQATTNALIVSTVNQVVYDSASAFLQASSCCGAVDDPNASSINYGMWFGRSSFTWLSTVILTFALDAVLEAIWQGHHQKTKNLFEDAELDVESILLPVAAILMRALLPKLTINGIRASLSKMQNCCSCCKNEHAYQVISMNG